MLFTPGQGGSWRAADGVGKVRNDHPDTSHDAARAIGIVMSRKQKSVYVAILDAGAAGMTDEQIQAATGMNPSTQRPRRVELVERGLIVDSGRKRPTASGRGTCRSFRRNQIRIRSKRTREPICLSRPPARTRRRSSAARFATMVKDQEPASNTRLTHRTIL